MADWDQRLHEATERAGWCTEAVIRKDGRPEHPWCAYSDTGTKLGCYPTKEAAEERLRHIEYWKRRDEAAARNRASSARRHGRRHVKVWVRVAGIGQRIRAGTTAGGWTDLTTDPTRAKSPLQP